MQIPRRLVALVALCALVQGSSAFTWDTCPDTLARGSVKDVRLTPDPPYPGSTTQFVVDGVADIELDSGKLSILVSYRGFPIYTKSQDLCTKTQCPVRKGPVTVSLEESFPVITPPGPYTVRITAAGPEARSPQILCLDVNFNVVPSPQQQDATAR